MGCFMQVFILWVLNFIAVELQDPFGNDANDFSSQSAQSEFNQQLVTMISDSAGRAPKLAAPKSDSIAGYHFLTVSELWHKMDRSAVKLQHARTLCRALKAHQRTDNSKCAKLISPDELDCHRRTTLDIIGSSLELSANGVGLPGLSESGVGTTQQVLSAPAHPGLPNEAPEPLPLVGEWSPITSTQGSVASLTQRRSDIDDGLVAVDVHGKGNLAHPQPSDTSKVTGSRLNKDSPLSLPSDIDTVLPIPNQLLSP